MFKLVDEKQEIEMGEMNPCDIGVVVDWSNNGAIVMRTASIDHFEVMSLSNPKPDLCWTIPNSLKVRLLKKGETITLKVI